MIATEKHLKTTAGIRGVFYFQFRDGDTIVQSPGMLTGAVQLDSTAGGGIITMPPDTENLSYPGLPAGLHTYEIRIAGVPAVRGLLEVQPSLLPPPETSTSVFFDLDLGTTMAINVEIGTGRNGTNGKDAYEIAVVQGYKGTRDQWLASLKGDSPSISGLVPWATYNAHANSTSTHVSTADRTKWNAAATGLSYAVKILWTNPPSGPYYRDDLHSACTSCGYEYDWLASSGCNLIVYTDTPTLQQPLLATLDSYKSTSPGSSYALQTVSLYTALREHISNGGDSPGGGGTSASTIRRNYWRLRWTKFPDVYSPGTVSSLVRAQLDQDGYTYTYDTDDACDIYTEDSTLAFGFINQLSEFIAPQANGTYTLQRAWMDVDPLAAACADRLNRLRTP